MKLNLKRAFRLVTFTIMLVGVLSTFRPSYAEAGVTGDADWLFTDSGSTRTYTRFVGNTSEIILDSVPAYIKHVVLETDCFSGLVVNSIRINKNVPLDTIKAGAFSNALGLSEITLESLTVGIAPITGLPTSDVVIRCYYGSTVSTWCTANGVQGVIYLPRIQAFDSNAAYDGTAHAASYAVTGIFTNGTIEVSYSKEGTSTWFNYSPTTAGTYSFYVSGSSEIDGIVTSEVKTLVVAQKEVTITGLQVTAKTYDGNTNATLTGGYATGVLDNDRADVIITLPYAGTYVNANVGSNKVVAPQMPVMGGTKAENYKLISPAITGSIGTKTLTLESLVATEREYDGTDNAVMVPGALQGVVAGDFVELDKITGTFEDKNVGINKIVTIRSATIKGDQADNYTLLTPAKVYTANVKRRNLTVSANNMVKYYGMDNPDFTLTYGGFVVGETIGNLAGFIEPIPYCAAAKDTVVGHSSIKVSGGNATANYQFIYVPGTLTISDPGTAALYTLNSSFAQSAGNTYVVIEGVGSVYGTSTPLEYKWAKGKHDLGYYNTANLGKGFTVLEDGAVYTMYIKLVDGTVVYKYQVIGVLSPNAVVATPAPAPAPVPIVVVDRVAPTISVKRSTTKATKSTVTLTIVTADETGLAKVTIDGKDYAGGAITYKCTKNKTITIIVTDTAGNSSTKKVTIKNIDKTKPKLSAKVKSGNVSITATDNVTSKSKIKFKYMSGYKYSGSYSKAKTAKTFTIKKNVVYTIFAKDAVGNIQVKRIRVSKTCKVKF